MSTEIGPELALEVSFVDLSGQRLSLEQKTWFGTEIISGRQSSTVLAKHYNLKADTLRKHARCIRNKVQMHLRVGRPRIIDANGFTKVAQKRQVMVEVSRRSLYAVLVEERRQTLKRRFPDIMESDLPKKLQKHTKERYINMFIEENVDEIVMQQISDALFVDEYM